MFFLLLVVHTVLIFRSSFSLSLRFPRLLRLTKPLYDNVGEDNVVVRSNSSNNHWGRVVGVCVRARDAVIIVCVCVCVCLIIATISHKRLACILYEMFRMVLCSQLFLLSNPFNSSYLSLASSIDFLRYVR